MKSSIFSASVQNHFTQYPQLLTESHRDGIEKFIRDHAYLFLIDIDKLIFGRDYEHYEQDEPGYTQATLDAYHYAFEQNIHRAIDENYIKAIHELAMAHRPQSNPGAFKSWQNGFNLRLHALSVDTKMDISSVSDIPPDLVRRLVGNLTMEGFWQLVERWLFPRQTSIHSIAFNTSGFSLLLNDLHSTHWTQSWPVIFEKKEGTVIHRALPYCPRLHNPRFEAFLRNNDFTCFLHAYGSHNSRLPMNRQDVSERVREICNSYNKSIRETRTEREKVKVIVEHMQLLNQLHPFVDGNIRTGYILLNRLLHEERLPLCILVNPNRLDGFSVEQLVDLVIQGQESFLQLVKNKMSTFILDKYVIGNPDDLIVPKPLIALKSKVDNFVSIIQKNLATLPQPSVSDSEIELSIGPSI